MVYYKISSDWGLWSGCNYQARKPIILYFPFYISYYTYYFSNIFFLNCYSFFFLTFPLLCNKFNRNRNIQINTIIIIELTIHIDKINTKLPKIFLMFLTSKTFYNRSYTTVFWIFKRKFIESKTSIRVSYTFQM